MENAMYFLFVVSGIVLVSEILLVGIIVICAGRLTSPESFPVFRLGVLITLGLCLLSLVWLGVLSLISGGLVQ